jgi:hypothetical protein
LAPISVLFPDPAINSVMLLKVPPTPVALLV